MSSSNSSVTSALDVDKTEQSSSVSGKNRIPLMTSILPSHFTRKNKNDDENNNEEESDGLDNSNHGNFTSSRRSLNSGLRQLKSSNNISSTSTRTVSLSSNSEKSPVIVPKSDSMKNVLTLASAGGNAFKKTLSVTKLGNLNVAQRKDASSLVDDHSRHSVMSTDSYDNYVCEAYGTRTIKT